MKYMETKYEKTTKKQRKREKSCEKVTNINGFVINSSKKIDIAIGGEYNEIMGKNQRFKGVSYE